MSADKPVDVIVETRGGTVVAIYARDPETRIILVDWDEFHDDGRAGVRYSPDSMSGLPGDTRMLVEAAS